MQRALKLQAVVSDTSSGSEFWNDSDLEDDNSVMLDEDDVSASATVKVIMLFVLSWQSMFRIANVATSSLFHFLSLLLHYLATLTQSQLLRHVAELIPVDTVKAQQIVNVNRDDFRQYVCCQKCCAIYNFNECFQQVGGQRVPKLCSACKFPRHPRPSFRGCCDSVLLKRTQCN